MSRWVGARLKWRSFLKRKTISCRVKYVCTGTFTKTVSAAVLNETAVAKRIYGQKHVVTQLID